MVPATCSVDGADLGIMRKKVLTILTIDDNPNCLQVTARFFTIVGGHIVEVAENGAEGLKKAAKLMPDLILLDMIMPDMNGLQVMDGLYANACTRDIPVIMITGSRLSDSEYGELESKGNFMLLEEKPTDFNRLLKTIEAAI